MPICLNDILHKVLNSLKLLANHINCVTAALIVSSSVILGGCSTLPVTPHLPESVQLETRLQQRFMLKDPSNVENSNPDSSNPDSSNPDSSNLDSYNIEPSTAKPVIMNSDIAGGAVETPALVDVVDNITMLHAEVSGYHPISEGVEAFAYRSVLTTMANKSIDAQYYIWKNDETGQLLLQDLWEAAERGVIVRLLLDDFNNNPEFDKHLLRFANHPNIAVRFINPLVYRKFQLLNLTTNLKRINRRMHNKSMTYDRKISVIGGRNIGDEYLSNIKSNQFADLDVLLIGPVVTDIYKSFDQYWNASISYDVQTLVDAPVDDKNQMGFIGQLDKLNNNNAIDAETKADIYDRTITEATIDKNLLNQSIDFVWKPIIFVSDDVNKITDSIDKKYYLVNQLKELLGTPNKQLTIVSSYFVPTRDGVDTFIKLANQGVKINILTNSYNATDVSAVHAGYSEWRKTLLKAGIKLYEVKAVASEEVDNKLWDTRSQSSTSLHAKTFAVDDSKVFIGSYNIDPRSADFNTEMGVIIKDETLARELHASISDELLTQAYEVVLAEDNQLQWKTVEADQIVYLDSEPNMDFHEWLWIKMMSFMPIDWLL